MIRIWLFIFLRSLAICQSKFARVPTSPHISVCFPFKEARSSPTRIGLNVKFRVSPNLWDRLSRHHNTETLPQVPLNSIDTLPRNMSVAGESELKAPCLCCGKAEIEYAPSTCGCPAYCKGTRLSQGNQYDSGS